MQPPGASGKDGFGPAAGQVVGAGFAVPVDEGLIARGEPRHAPRYSCQQDSESRATRPHHLWGTAHWPSRSGLIIIAIMIEIVTAISDMSENGRASYTARRAFM